MLSRKWKMEAHQSEVDDDLCGGVRVELLGFGKDERHFPDAEEDRWGKMGMEFGVERRALRRGRRQLLVRVGQRRGWLRQYWLFLKTEDLTVTKRVALLYQAFCASPAVDMAPVLHRPIRIFSLANCILLKSEKFRTTLENIAQSLRQCIALSTSK